MDLFLAQDDARQRTGGLVSLLVMVIAGVVLVLHFIGVILSGGALSSSEDHLRVLPWTLPLAVFFVAGGVIARVYALRNGGSAVAEELGGHRIHPATRNPGEARLITPVEELAVAAGIPVPEVWVLQGEDAINAFVAGNDPSKAVVGVTRGALERLTREELQAVLAHEFSHIVGGEMRLNFSLLAWVQGILFLTLVGRRMIRSGFEGNVSPKRAKSKKAIPASEGTNMNGESIPILGLILVAIGSVSSVFGRIFQGAICRDREVFADVAAVEMTNNSAALVRAMKKMGGMESGSLLMSPNASQVGHLFFGQAAVGVFSWMFPTHPPIEERILQLEPDWSGDFLRSVAEPVVEEMVPAQNQISGATIGRPRALSYRASVLDLLANSAGPGHSSQGQAAIRALPAEWRKLTRSIDGSRKLAFEICKPSSTAELDLGNASPSQIVLLLDLAMPLLRRIDPGEYWTIMRFCRREVHRGAGENVDVFRFMTAHVLGRRLGIALSFRDPAPVYYEELPSVWEDVRVLLSMMVNIASPTQTSRLIAYSNAWAFLGVNVEHLPDIIAEVSLAQLVSALNSCEEASAVLKRQILLAVGIAAVYEGEIPERELVLVRLIADAIGAPIPVPLRAA